MGLKQIKKGKDIARLPHEQAAAPHNKVGAAEQVGQPDDYLYIIADGKFYRLSPTEVKKNPIDMTTTPDVDKGVVRALTSLRDTNAVVADLQAPGAVAASCACIALNIDIFDTALQTSAKGG
jgi:hypothetical protein